MNQNKPDAGLALRGFAGSACIVFQFVFLYIYKVKN